MQRDNWTLLFTQAPEANTRNAKNKDNMQTHPYLRRMYVQYGYPYLAVHPYLLTVHPQKVHSAIVLSFVHLTV